MEKGRMAIMSEEYFFRMAGMNENSARILALVISNPEFKIDKLPSELDLSKKICNSLVRKLVSKRRIEITSDETIRIIPNFAISVARELETSTEKFADRLRATRFFIVEKFAEEIEGLFQSEGYRIKKELVKKRGFRIALAPGLEFELHYRFVVEKFYRFGVLIFNPQIFEQVKQAKKRVYEYFGHIILELEEESNCIGTFVFFDPRLNDKDVNIIKKLLLEGQRVLRYREGRSFLFIHDPEQNIQDFLKNDLDEIENRREIVDERFKEIRDEMSNTRDLIVENSMLITQLRSLTSGQYLPYRDESKKMVKFMSPVESVVNREARNLEIFEREYGEEKTHIEGEMDNFDKRWILPNPTNLKERLKNVIRLKSKFEPIRHELRFLAELLLSRYVRGDEPMKINPFILTEPNNIETFTINQDNMGVVASNFFKHLISGGSNLLFIVGSAGSGKTHALKHIFYSHAKKQSIWPIYVDCPMKYDIVSSLFIEVVQERNFPKDVHQFLPSLRKLKVSTELEFVEVIKKLNDIMIVRGYKGLIFLIDELENSLPYTYKVTQKRDREEAPLALRQLREVLSSDLVTDVGFVFAFRDHILSEVKNNLKLKDFDSFIVNPESLNVNHFKELIKLRYKTWESKQIKFQLPVIKEVTSITNSNTRHTIQYFRALYHQAFAEERKTITLKTLEKTGKIPLFTY